MDLKLAAIQMQATGAARCELFIMGDNHQASAMVTVETKQQIGNLVTGMPIQITGRLIGQQQRGLTNKGTGNRHPLLLATR